MRRPCKLHLCPAPSLLTSSPLRPHLIAVLVGTLDNPLYEATLASSKATSSAAAAAASTASPNVGVHSPAIPTSFSIFGAPQSGSTPNAAAVARGGAGGSGAMVGYGQKTGPDGRHVMQLVAHASLDVVEDVQWTNGAMRVLGRLGASPYAVKSLT